MEKNKVMLVVSLAILLLLFNVVVFMLPIDQTSVFWVAYVFTSLAILLQIAICSVALGKGKTIKSKFLGFSIIYIGFFYLFLQLGLGIVLMVLPAESVSPDIAIVISVVLLGSTVISIIATDVSRDEIEKIDNKVKGKVIFIKSLQADIKNIATKVEDDKLKGLIIKLADTILYSDPMSNEALSSIEKHISDKCSELAQAVFVQNYDLAIKLAKETEELFIERNDKCKLLK